MFLWTLQILFGIFICDDVTARDCGFLNITSQTNGGILEIKIIFMEQKECLLCNWESRECKHLKIIKVSDSFYCFSDFRDKSTLLLAVCNVLSAERDVLT